MPTFLAISRHSPESCPMFDDKRRKGLLELTEKLEGVAKKHGVKVVGLWNVFSEHLTVAVYEAPSLEAFQKLQMDPELAVWYAFNTQETKIALGMEDIVKMLKQAKPAR